MTGMKLTTKSEYACLAIIDLVEHRADGMVKIEDIARRKDIPKKYLEQILLLLKRAGYVGSRRGAAGGYRLAKEPEKISVAEIIRLLDGALSPIAAASKYFYDHSPMEKNRRLLGLMKTIRDYVARTLENTSFADLVSR
jgi:Rrf2 family protein